MLGCKALAAAANGNAATFAAASGEIPKVGVVADKPKTALLATASKACIFAVAAAAATAAAVGIVEFVVGQTTYFFALLTNSCCSEVSLGKAPPSNPNNADRVPGPNFTSPLCLRSYIGWEIFIHHQGTIYFADNT
uniref:Uncharacterized protein n=1 Tax=Glossina palpalis gambiensis TaxID=67801 RepID=A0A1B0ARP5_9MUSC